MDPNLFDTLTRRYAAMTRRAALGGLFGGGLLATLGLRSAPNVAAATACTLTWKSNVRLGPSAGALLDAGASQPGEVKGTLTLSLGDDGAIESGQLTLADGQTLAVVGQAVGRALNLRLQDSNGGTLIAVGTGEQAITSCAGRIDGPLTGPQEGDLGDWHAVASGTDGSNSAGAAPNPAGAGDDGEACASGVVCGGVCCQPAAGLTADNIACNVGACECTYSCAAAGCGGGDGAIINTCGSDPQPHCHDQCNVPQDNGCGDMTCADGQTLDTDTCTCVPAGGGGVCPEGQAECGGTCIDVLSDHANCGACGNACPDDQVCSGGECFCAIGTMFKCNGQCVDTQNDPENCGGCGNHCPSGQCIEGNCTDVVN